LKFRVLVGGSFLLGVEVEAEDAQAALDAAKKAADAHLTCVEIGDGWLVGGGEGILGKAIGQRAFGGRVVAASGPELTFRVQAAEGDPAQRRDAVRATIREAFGRPSGMAPPDPPPRYDEVYREGVAALDAGGRDNPGDEEPSTPGSNTLANWSDLISARASPRARANRAAAATIGAKPEPLALPDAPGTTALATTTVPVIEAELIAPEDEEPPKRRRQRAAPEPKGPMDLQAALAEAKRRWGPGGQIMPNPGAKNSEHRYWVGDRDCNDCNVGYGPGWFGRGASWEDAFLAASRNGFKG